MNDENKNHNFAPRYFLETKVFVWKDFTFYLCF